jgi:hypothetical protein
MSLRQKRSIGEYLAFLSVKYEVDPDDFLHALRLAKEENEATIDNISVQCRGRAKDKFIFLIKKESKVLAQFPVDDEFLVNRSNQLRNFTKTEKIRNYLAKKNRLATANCIEDLRGGMQHINLTVKVVEVTEPKHVVTRHGNRVVVAKALVQDKTGTINLVLWNGQINTISPGDTVLIENAKVSSFRGERHLSIGRKGTLSNIKKLETLNSVK